jgi:hypothetical protein
MGFIVTRADNVCFAEIYAEAQQFAGAVYDQSLSEEEQVSLARVMRIRWPWMRIIRWVPPDNSFSPRTFSDDTLFDCSAVSESQLASCVKHSFGGRRFPPC